MAGMKCVVLVGDGLADDPVGSLGGKTPLEVARTPNLDRMASRGLLGLTRTLPPNTAMAGATASLAVLGYDPVRFHGSCSAFEAVARGLVLEPGDVAFRLDLVTLERREDGMLVMGDVTGGRPSTVDARILLEDVTRAIAGDGIEVHPGVGYRHLMVWRGGAQGTQTTPPCLIAGEPVAPALPNGPGAERLRAMIDRAGDVLRAHPLCATRRARGEGAPNAIWPWGEGGRRTLPAMRDRFGVEGAVIAAADMVRGLGKLAGLRVVDVPGGEGEAHSSLRAEVDSGLQVLDERDFLLLHVAAPDDGGTGDAQRKIEAIERIDEELLGPLLDGLRARGGEWRVMVLAHHPAACGRRTRAADAEPFAVYVSRDDEKNRTVKRSYHERDAREQGIFIPEAHTLVERLLRI
jgi:2,3-bisphosphoglycerate-independent phosphoglycerate mutase